VDLLAQKIWDYHHLDHRIDPEFFVVRPFHFDDIRGAQKSRRESCHIQPRSDGQERTG
jgi:hypothetical protein